MSQSVQNVNPRWDDPSAHKGQYPPDWDARRDVVFERDNYTCQSCGHMSGPHAGSEGRVLHPHHIVPISQGGWHSFSNLETLCGLCHNGQHAHDIFASDDWEDRGVISRWISGIVRFFLYSFVITTVMAVYGATLIGVMVSIAGSTGLPSAIIGMGAVAVLVGSVVAIRWPRTVGSVFAVAGMALAGLAGSAPGVQSTDPAVALILSIFGLPALLAAGKLIAG